MGEKLRAMVVDDEPLARDELVFLLGETGDVEIVAECGSATEALRQLDVLAPDVVFADLRMPGPDGLALAEAVLRRSGTVVVVVSAHDEALRAFEVGIADYVLKPPRLSRLTQSIERVRARLAVRREEASDAPLTRLAVRRRNSYVVVDVADVLVFEMKDELVWAVTKDERYALDLTLAAIESRLTDAFFRCHRGAIVRVDAIRALEPSGAGTFEMILDHPQKLRVPLARERAKLLRERIPIAG